MTGSSTGTTRFLYSGDELGGEYNASGTLLPTATSTARAPAPFDNLRVIGREVPGTLY